MAISSRTPAIDVVPAELGHQPVQRLLVGEHGRRHDAEPDRQLAVAEHGHGAEQADHDGRDLGGEAERIRAGPWSPASSRRRPDRRPAAWPPAESRARRCPRDRKPATAPTSANRMKVRRPPMPGSPSPLRFSRSTPIKAPISSAVAKSRITAKSNCSIMTYGLHSPDGTARRPRSASVRAALGLAPVRFTAATLPAEVGDRFAAALDGWRSRQHGLAGAGAAAARLARSPVAGGAHRDRLRAELRAGRRSAARAGARRDRGYLSVYARHRDYHDVLKGRLKELAGWIAARFGLRGQGVRRHRPGAGEAAGAAGGPRLAGQAHQPGQPRARLLAVPGRDPDRPRRCRRTSPSATIAAAAAAASTSARPTPSRRPTGSMRGAASAT